MTATRAGAVVSPERDTQIVLLVTGPAAAVIVVGKKESIATGTLSCPFSSVVPAMTLMVGAGSICGMDGGKGCVQLTRTSTLPLTGRPAPSVTVAVTVTTSLPALSVTTLAASSLT